MVRSRYIQNRRIAESLVSKRPQVGPRLVLPTIGARFHDFVLNGRGPQIVQVVALIQHLDPQLLHNDHRVRSELERIAGWRHWSYQGWGIESQERPALSDALLYLLQEAGIAVLVFHGLPGTRRTSIASIERCQARSARSQRNHISLSLRAFVRLELHCFHSGISWFHAKLDLARDAVRAYFKNPQYRLKPSTA